MVEKEVVATVGGVGEGAAVATGEVVKVVETAAVVMGGWWWRRWWRRRRWG